MSRIKILPEILSNKIAAGEVVERPASVVKELLENALDAESDRIIIEIENGGRRLIRVADNGTGMARDDALLSLERYATSKLWHDRDLFAIRTLGFRGEALPSIASVSRFQMVTCARGAQTGTEIVVHGGTFKRVADTGAPEGTMVTVGQLFFNTPARRKFLKQTTTEIGHIVDTVSSAALGRPAVLFQLIHNGRPLKSWAPAVDPLERIVDVLGRDCHRHMHPLAGADPAVKLRGWIASPRLYRRTSRGIYIYVNGRFVRDRLIQHALFQGYAGRLMKGQFPLAVLYVDLAPETVDVNVHPTKHEVRFQASKAVHAAVAAAVSETLRKKERPSWAPSASVPRPVSAPRNRVMETVKPFERFTGQTGPAQADTAATSKRLPRRGAQSAVVLELPGKGPPRRPDDETQNTLWPDASHPQLRLIGQLADTYILCEAAGELVAIDQHAAHERVVYEQLQRQAAASAVAAQRLLMPETLELGYREAALLEKMRARFEVLGVEIEPFGGHTFVIKSVPALIAHRDITRLVGELLEKTVALGGVPDLEKHLNAYLAVMACHGVVRARQRMTPVEMQALIDQLVACDTPSSCPHGRPTWIRWTFKSLEKSFRRLP